MSGDDDLQSGKLGLVGNLGRRGVSCGTCGLLIGEGAESAVRGAIRWSRRSSGGSRNRCGRELTGLPVNHGVGGRAAGDERGEGGRLPDDNTPNHR